MLSYLGIMLHAMDSTTDHSLAPVLVVRGRPEDRDRLMDVVRSALDQSGVAAEAQRAGGSSGSDSTQDSTQEEASPDVVPIRELERRAIENALRVTGGRVEAAAKLLGMGRATLYRRLAAWASEAPAPPAPPAAATSE